VNGQHAFIQFAAAHFERFRLIREPLDLAEAFEAYEKGVPDFLNDIRVDESVGGAHAAPLSFLIVCIVRRINQFADLLG
jgi:hypothetical protein